LAFQLLIEPIFWARIKLLHALRMSPFDIAVFAMPISFIIAALAGPSGILEEAIMESLLSLV
jgi:hypothetical protein